MIKKKQTINGICVSCILVAQTKSSVCPTELRLLSLLVWPSWNKRISNNETLFKEANSLQFKGWNKNTRVDIRRNKNRGAKVTAESQR